MITDYESAVAYLDAHIGRGVKPGLDRITALLDLMAHPEMGYPIIHVAGTNGKTSTARMAASLISAHGVTPGTFTSPHLQRVEERFTHGLRTMTPSEFAQAMGELGPIVDLAEERLGEGITYFELTAALAHSWFADRAVGAAVVEVGLGGRLDATNAATSEVALVTTIALEHTEYLGNTIEEIAAEKLAILDEGAALVTGVVPEPVVELAAAVVESKSGSWFAHGVDFDVVDPEPVPRGWSFGIRSAFGDYDGIELHLRGRHQVDNFANAVAAVEALFGRGLDETGVRESAATVTAPGRLEVVRSSPLLVLDGAHNHHAAEALATALVEEFPSTSWQLVFGAMRDKDVGAMLTSLRERVAGVHSAAARSPRARSADEVAAIADGAMGVETHSYGSVAEALAGAMGTGDAVLVAGSIYVVGEARDALGL